MAQTLSPPAPLTTTSSPLAHASPSTASPPVSSPSEPSSKKRKSPAHKASSNSVSNQRRRAEQDRPGGGGGGGRKGSSKGGGAGSDRDTRWAEQLLYPCAAAVEAGNLSRAQHLFYVLGELASFSGDANHRLVAHGLHALSRRLPAAVGTAAAAVVMVVVVVAVVWTVAAVVVVKTTLVAVGEVTAREIGRASCRERVYARV